MAVGRAIDTALSRFGHEMRLGRRPTQTAMAALAERELDEALAEAAVAIEAPERASVLARIQETLRAYRRSELAGLPRPRTRVVLIAERVGVYAQPDYWDGRHRFYEMKSFRAIPPPPDIALQLRLFQLAYPGFESVLVCLDRHRVPVDILSSVIPPPTDAERAETLRLAYAVGNEVGEEKVLEYVEGPFVRYPLPPAAADDPAAAAGRSTP